jgi:hypothetical protein
MEAESQYNAHFGKPPEHVIILENGRARSFSLVKAAVMGLQEKI